MKRVLVIANLFHASPRISGLATYLPDFGWQASIITPPVGPEAASRFGFPSRFLERTVIVDAPYAGDIFHTWRRLFKKAGFNTSESLTEQLKERIGMTAKRSMVDIIMTWYQTVFAFPDTERTWKSPALKVAAALLAQKRFDAILSSSPFPTSHVVAARLKEQTGLPWAADFRDPWTMNQNYPYSSLRKVVEMAYEKTVMKKADALITVSPSCADKIASLHDRPVSVITNGFDPDTSADLPVALTQEFTITYTGTIYPQKQDPRKFLAALRRLIKRNHIDPKDICVRFFGKKDNWLRHEVHAHALTDIVEQHAVVPRCEAFSRQRESQLLLMFNWEDPEETGIYTLKLFDYLAAKRPVLATGGYRTSEVRNILETTKAGRYATSTEEIEASLRSSYREFKEHGSVRYDGCWDEVCKYSYTEGARRLADMLARCAGTAH